MNSGLPFQWFVYQQDYLWFLAALGWATLAGAWWRLGRKEKSLTWLPWAALAALLTTAVEISQLITPVTLKPFAAPWLAWDLALGGIQALLVAGLWWSLARLHRWAWWRILPACILAAAAAALRQSHPVTGSLVLAVLGLVPALGLIRATQAGPAARLALLLLGATALLGSNGPLGEWCASPRRYTEISAFGLLAATGWLLTLGAAGLALYRESQRAPDPADKADFALLIRAQALWLVLGLGLAAVMSHWARASFEQNLLARVRMAAELIDRKYLAANLGPEFRVDEIKSMYFLGNELTYYRSEYLAGKNLHPIAASLSAIELANPDAVLALILTMRGGWLVEYAESSRMPPPAYPGELGRLGRPDWITWLSWSGHRVNLVGPVDFYYGYVVQARAPLLSPDNKKMLGWLAFDLSVSHWLAAQVQARLLAFLVIAIGSTLLFVSWQLRVRERVRANARREADAALAASRIKSAFLAKVSHELRTPIQSLLGYSELLRQRLAGDPKAAGWLASLQQHGELMTRLINDLIDLSAVEAGAFTLSPRPVETAGVLTQTVESFRPRAEARNLTLACFVGTDVPAWVLLDGERFRQVLTNLLGNALKFTERGGVTVALHAEPESRLRLTVRDTGPGIPLSEQARLFVAFSRLELTADKEGTGLGLALSSALCRAMGGDLTVASDGVTGSCFTATFHALETSRPPGATPVDPLTTLRSRRVLVVDDNPLVRELFIAFLTEQGALCAAAGTGAEAVAQANAGGFDAIILDLALPDGDGTHFVGPLRAAAPDARLVGVSAHASTADRTRALAAGMEVFLTKPVPLGALAAAVAAASGGRTGEAPAFRTAEALRDRLARQFIRELPGQHAGLATAIAAREWSRVCSLAHQMKNSAVVVRDDALFDVCTGLEQAAAAGDEAVTLLWWARCAPHLERWTGDATFSAPPTAGFHHKTPSP